MSTEAGGADDWLASVMGPEPTAAPARVPSSDVLDRDAHDGGVDSGVGVVDLDDVLGDSGAPYAGPADSADAAARKTALALGAVVTVVGVVIASLLFWFSDDDPPPAAAPIVTTQPLAPPTPTQAPVAADAPILFTASSPCPAGSTSAQALSETSVDSAWVCVRGGTDGQVLTIDLGKSYVLTAVSVTPGWVAKTPGGSDEWLQHRVVTRLQYIFTNGAERTIRTQDTGNAHGPVTMPLENILASRVTVIILQTARPPADPLPGPGEAGEPEFLPSLSYPTISSTLSPAPAPGEPGSDPVDATFAMSEMKFIGHLPN